MDRASSFRGHVVAPSRRFQRPSRIRPRGRTNAVGGSAFRRRSSPLDRRLTNTVCGPLRDPAYVARICRWRRDTCGAWDRWWQQQGIQARPTGSPWFCGAGINGVGVSAAGEVLRLPVGAISGDWGGGATPVEPLSRCCSPGLHEVLIVAILQPDLNCLRPCHLGIWQARRRRYATPIAAGHCSPLERLPHAVTPLRGCRTR